VGGGGGGGLQKSASSVPDLYSGQRSRRGTKLSLKKQKSKVGRKYSLQEGAGHPARREVDVARDGRESRKMENDGLPQANLWPTQRGAAWKMKPGTHCPVILNREGSAG